MYSEIWRLFEVFKGFSDKFEINKIEIVFSYKLYAYYLRAKYNYLNSTVKEKSETN